MEVLEGHRTRRRFAAPTSGESAAARDNCLGPVKTAEGMISPKKSTTVTDNKQAIQEGTSLLEARSYSDILRPT